MSEHFAFPPFRMKAKTAAFYCGMSESAFARAVESGDMPKGQTSAGGVYWLRRDLESAMLPSTENKTNFGQKI